MEIWLKKEQETIQLPILPASFSVSMENLHQNVNVHTRGDVTILGKRGLQGLELSSFFPAQDYPFAAYPKDREPYDYVKKLIAWQDDPVRVTITDTNINMLMVMQSFSYGEPDSSGDIAFSIAFQEYRPPKYSKPEIEEKLKSTPIVSKMEESTSRPFKEVTQKTYTVKLGDNLWNLAKQFYGSGSKMSKLYSANKSVIEAAAKKHGHTSSSNKGVAGWWIFPGTKLVIPT